MIDLTVGPGEVTAQVMGSSLYQITVSIRELAGTHWRAIARDCARSIDTLVELLQGHLSNSVMERNTHGREPASSRHRRRFPSAAAARIPLPCASTSPRLCTESASGSTRRGTSVRLAKGRRQRVDRRRRRGRDTGSETAGRRSNSGLVKTGRRFRHRFWRCRPKVFS